MTSEVVNYRTAVIEAIKDKCPDLVEVDWYDAIFDDTDLREWSVNTPCAFVAVRDVPARSQSTGELALSLDVAVIVVTADVEARSSDGEAWSFMERIAILANYNKFGLEKASVPSGINMARLREPALRRMGVALSLVEWTAGLNLGPNRTVEDWYFVDPASGQLIIRTPKTMVANAAIGASREQVSITGAAP